MERLKYIIGQNDLFIQKQIIINSYTAMRMNLNWQDKKTFKLESTLITNKKFKKTSYRTIDELVNHLLQLIYSKRIETSTAVNWPSIALQADITWNPVITSVDLYNGIAGIGLVFAIAARQYDNSDYLRVAQKSYLTIKDKFLSMKNIKTSGYQHAFFLIGGYSGIGGILYSLYTFYQFWQNLEIVDLINQMVIYAEHFIQFDDKYDVIGGTAGFILVLSILSSVLDPVLFRRVLKKSLNHLFKNYPMEKLHEITKTNKKKFDQLPLIGFSHGTSGIAAALAKAYTFFPSKQISKWIDTIIQYEDRWYSKYHKNWPDLRYLPDNKRHYQYSMTWCHGIPGISLSRILLNKLGFINDQRNYEKILTEKIKLELNKDCNPCLCHGSLGNLLVLHQIMQSSEKVSGKDFSIIQSKVFRHLQQQLNNIQGQFSNMGLMTGLSGVVYAYLILNIEFSQDLLFLA